MMGKTHMIAGIGAAVLISPPDTIGGCLQALLGGALGGLICDLDVQSSTYCRDARVVRNTALLLGAVILFLDWKWSTGIWDHIGSHLGSRQLLGLGIFLVITIAGKLSSHRSFTHSFLALGFLMAAFYFLYAPLIPYVAAGFLSHMFLDLLNKKPVEIIYPYKKGVCLRLFSADGLANRLICTVSLVFVVVQMWDIMWKLVLGAAGRF